MADGIVEKRCCRCKETKPASQFYVNRRRPSGLTDACSSCLEKRKKELRQQRRAAKLAIIGPKIGKFCGCCKRDLPLSEFSADRHRKLGLDPYCKACKREKARAFRQTPLGKLGMKKIRRSAAYKRYFKKRSKTEKERERGRRKQKTASARASRKRYYERNKIKFRAHYAVHSAVKKGTLPRPDTLQCCKCGNSASEYHHESYDRPMWLVVVPVCKDCHEAIPNSPATGCESSSAG